MGCENGEKEMIIEITDEGNNAAEISLAEGCRVLGRISIDGANAQDIVRKMLDSVSGLDGVSISIVDEFGKKVEDIRGLLEELNLDNK